jgi:hypothetical protein
METTLYELQGRLIEAGMFAHRDHDVFLGLMVVLRDIADRRKPTGPVADLGGKR